MNIFNIFNNKMVYYILILNLKKSYAILILSEFVFSFVELRCIASCSESSQMLGNGKCLLRLLEIISKSI